MNSLATLAALEEDQFQVGRRAPELKSGGTAWQPQSRLSKFLAAPHPTPPLWPITCAELHDVCMNMSCLNKHCKQRAPSQTGSLGGSGPRASFHFLLPAHLTVALLGQCMGCGLHQVMCVL